MPLSVLHAKNITIPDMAGVLTLFNSSGGTTTQQATDIALPADWNSAHNFTLALSASEFAPALVVASGLTSSSNASSLSLGVMAAPWWEPFPLPNTNSTLSAPGIGTWYLDGPYQLAQNWNSGQLNCLVSNAAGFVHGTTYSAASTGSMSWSATFANHLALYRQGTGASTTRLESVWSDKVSILVSQNIALGTANTSSGTISNRLTVSFPSQWDISGGITYGTTSQSGTTAVTTSTMASTIANNLITGAVAYASGARMDPIPLATAITPGVYWLAHMLLTSSSSSGTAGGIGTAHTLFSAQSRLGLLENAVGAYKRLGLTVSNATTNVQPFKGFLATTSTGATSVIATSDMRATTGRAYVNYLRSNY